jgi:hypothetical protein
VEYHVVPPEAELEQLRRDVASRPEHPLKGQLAEYEKRRLGEWTTHRFTYFAESDERWRICMELFGAYQDSAVRGREAWQLDATHLRLFDLTRLGESSAVDPRRKSTVFKNHVSQLLDGGFAVGSGMGLRVADVRVKGDAWTFRANDAERPGAPASYEVRYEGRWDAAAGRGFCERMTLPSADMYQDGWGTVCELEGWRFDEVLGAWAASRATSRFPDGRVDATVVRESSVSLPPDGMEGVLREPKPAAIDTVRGKVAVRFIENFRDLSVSEATEAGTMKVGTIQYDFGARRSEREWLRPVGWALVAAAAGLLIWIRATRKG